MSLDITVISAKDLKNTNLFHKMDVYVVVSINGDFSTEQTTPVDKHCGTEPKWHCTMKFTINEAAAQQNRLTLVFHLKSERNLCNKDIGEVRVPIKELLNNNDSSSGKVVTYDVKLPNGKVKGSLDFSYKFEKKATVNNEPTMEYPSAGYVAASSSAYGPPGGHWHLAPPTYPPVMVPGNGQYQLYPPAAAPGYGYPGVHHGYPPVGMGAGSLSQLGLFVGDMIKPNASTVAVYEAGYMNGTNDGFDF